MKKIKKILVIGSSFALLTNLLTILTVLYTQDQRVFSVSECIYKNGSLELCQVASSCDLYSQCLPTITFVENGIQDLNFGIEQLNKFHNSNFVSSTKLGLASLYITDKNQVDEQKYIVVMNQNGEGVLKLMNYKMV